jgi:hypothetical protein
MTEGATADLAGRMWPRSVVVGDLHSLIAVTRLRLSDVRRTRAAPVRRAGQKPGPTGVSVLSHRGAGRFVR